MKLGPNKKKAAKKFKKKVLVTFVLISIIPLLAIIVSNIYLIIKNRQATIVEQEKLAIDNARNKITKYFQEQSEALNLVVSAPIDSIWNISPNDINFLLQNSFEIGKPLSLDFIDKQGVITAKINQRKEFAYNSSYLSLYNNSGISNDLGNYDIISNSEADVSGSPDFESAIKGESYYGLLEFVDGAPVMRISSQIQNLEKEIIGVISAEIKIEEIQNLISEIRLGSSGFLYVVDKDGNLIASGDPRLGSIGSSQTRNPIIHEALKRQASSESFQTYLSPGNGTSAWNAGYLPDIGWSIISEWPVTDAFSVLGNLFFWSALIALLILAAVIILAAFFANTITKPISELARGADEIKGGNLKYTLDLRTGDEFELLGHQFNDMIKVLNENQRLRDEFVFIAAHELRTPVTAIRGYLEMILDGIFGPVSDQVKENLRVVEKANMNLVELVQNLLEIARNEAGKMTIEMEAIDLTDKIKTVNTQLASLALEKKIQIDFKPLAEKVMVQADSGKLNEVLVNIIGNAIKYTLGDGAIEIWQEEQDNSIVTHIKDHGIGMSEEELSKLFSKFYRVKNSETAKIQGTGLGLFITKEIVERMEGSISVSSKKGEGSVFSFSLKKAT
jgi:signal transduction histidine kinase